MVSGCGPRLRNVTIEALRQNSLRIKPLFMQVDHGGGDTAQREVATMLRLHILSSGRVTASDAPRCAGLPGRNLR